MIYIKVRKKLFSYDLECEFSLKKGDFLGITGKSGSGKTTLLRIIAGLEKGYGEIIVDNKYWLNKNKTLPPQKRDIGFVFQNYALFPNMSVIENLLYVNKDKKFALKLLEMTGLKGLKNRYPNMLSGGEKQRVALIRAIIKKPKILLLDEPFSAIDVEMKEKLYEDLLTFHNEFNLTTIMVTHSMKEIYKFSNKVVVLENGKIIKKGDRNIFFSNNSSEKFFIEGEIIDFIKADILDIAIISVGDSIVEVVITQKDKFKIGDKVVISTKAFNLNIRKRDENFVSRR